MELDKIIGLLKQFSEEKEGKIRLLQEGLERKEVERKQLNSENIRLKQENININKKFDTIFDTLKDKLKENKWDTNT